MGFNNPIKSDDPQAIEKLTAKLEKCQQQQEFMKDVNKYYKKNGTLKGYPDISDEEAIKLDAQIKSNYSWAQQPYLSYYLQNNNQEINRLKKRIDELKRNKEVGFVGWEFNGGKAVANQELNRLQLLFDEKPSEEQRSELKYNGFRWSPKNQAWQRQLNDNAIYAASRISFIQPKDNSSIRSLQPKAPSKDDLAR